MRSNEEFYRASLENKSEIYTETVKKFENIN